MVDDIARKPVTLRRLIAGSFLLGGRLSAGTVPGQRMGVLLPNSTAAAMTFFGMQAYGRVPALLNFTTGARGMQTAVTAAELRTLVTSRRFVEAAKLAGVVQALGQSVRLIWLEDLRIGRFARLSGLLKTFVARAAHRRVSRATPEDAAVVLFTSGSEGTPKGVVPSHRNILANKAQLATVVDFNPTDIVLNALPMFHAFGLTGGFLLPVLSGVRTFLYPPPLHFRIVPLLAYDFYSLRYVFAGAEHVREETRRAWFDKFGLRLLEGHGATETAPVIATNTAMMFRAGNVGPLLPGIEARLEPVEGVACGGRLFVKGANVMLDYLRAETPGVVEQLPDGWYDTGDAICEDRGRDAGAGDRAEGGDTRRSAGRGAARGPGRAVRAAADRADIGLAAAGSGEDRRHPGERPGGDARRQRRCHARRPATHGMSRQRLLRRPHGFVSIRSKNNPRRPMGRPSPCPGPHHTHHRRRVRAGAPVPAAGPAPPPR